MRSIQLHGRDRGGPGMLRERWFVRIGDLGAAGDSVTRSAVDSLAADSGGWLCQRTLVQRTGCSRDLAKSLPNAIVRLDCCAGDALALRRKRTQQLCLTKEWNTITHNDDDVADDLCDWMHAFLALALNPIRVRTRLATKACHITIEGPDVAFKHDHST